jgi:hypothetical protein
MNDPLWTWCFLFVVNEGLIVIVGVVSLWVMAMLAHHGDFYDDVLRYTEIVLRSAGGL